MAPASLPTTPDPISLDPRIAAALLLTSPALAAQGVLYGVASVDPSVGLGTAVAGISDVDGDGVRDFAISAPSALPLGTVTLRSGLDLTPLATPRGPISGITGQTWYFQAWHRDLLGPQVTFKLSDSLGVTLR